MKRISLTNSGIQNEKSRRNYEHGIVEKISVDIARAIIKSVFLCWLLLWITFIKLNILRVIMCATRSCYYDIKINKVASLRIQYLIWPDKLSILALNYETVLRQCERKKLKPCNNNKCNLTTFHPKICQKKTIKDKSTSFVGHFLCLVRHSIILFLLWSWLMMYDFCLFC